MIACLALLLTPFFPEEHIVGAAVRVRGDSRLYPPQREMGFELHSRGNLWTLWRR
jgi:hypothetical protein